MKLKHCLGRYENQKSKSERLRELDSVTVYKIQMILNSSYDTPNFNRINMIKSELERYYDSRSEITSRRMGLKYKKVSGFRKFLNNFKK